MSIKFVFFLMGFVLSTWVGIAYSADYCVENVESNIYRVVDTDQCYEFSGLSWSGSTSYSTTPCDSGITMRTGGSSWWLYFGTEDGGANTGKQYVTHPSVTCPEPPPCEIQGLWVLNQDQTAYECIDQTCNPGEVVDESNCDGTPQPAHCNNYILDNGEDGVDCGGLCSNECQSVCPDGSYLYEQGMADDRCVFEYQPDNYGNCEKLTDYYYPPYGEWSNGFCSRVFDPTLSAEHVNLELPAIKTPWSGNSGETASTDVTYQDNGDGTTSKTTTKTTQKTGKNGETETTTETTTETYDENGNLIGSETTTETTTEGNDSDNADVVAALTGKSGIRDTIKDQTEALQGKIGEVKKAVDDLTIEAPDSLSTEISDDIDTTGTTALDDYQTELDTEVSVLVNDFDPSELPISETVTSKFQSIIPESQSCSPVTFSSPSGRSFTIECETFDRTRLILGWMIGLWTMNSLYNIFMGSRPK